MSVLKYSEMRNWDIIVDSEAIPSEKYAAQEFQHFFEQATDILLPVHNSNEKASNHVYIGKSAALSESGITVDASKLGEEGLHIIIKDDVLVIVGGRPRGTLYGVYQFIEDELEFGF